MSLSREGRIANIAEALRLMMKEAGERHFEAVFVNPHAPTYEAIENTTWKELIDRHLINDIGHGCVAFTSSGWRVTMLSLNLHEGRDFKERLGRLSAALKDKVKGRNQAALVGTSDLAAQTGLKWEFIVNVLKSNMIQELFGIKGAEISDDRVLIEIPIDYGLRPL